MNVRIYELIFMGKYEREFSLLFEAHERIVFLMVRHFQSLFTDVYLTETRLFVLKEVLMTQMKITLYHNDNREVKLHLTTKS